VFLVACERVAEWLVIILMSRELAITMLRSIATSYGLVMSAGRGGKTKTALQTVGIIFLLIHFRYPILFTGRTLDFHQVGTYTLYLSLVMSIWSAGEYFRFFVRAAQEKERRMRSQEPPAS
jgi:CDP-diacylglycerol--glycerol-3-phosphate 3-phosphatidyltransferase